MENNHVICSEMKEFRVIKYVFIGPLKQNVSIENDSQFYLDVADEKQHIYIKILIDFVIISYMTE